jgi:hypothetical protein
MMRVLRSFVVAAMLMLLSTPAALAVELVEVFIDARDPAYVVVQGVNSDTPQVAWREMEGYAQMDNVSMMSWPIFRKNARTVLAPYVKRDDYPQSQVLMGVLSLVAKYPGRPFAVTWNGGVATTFFDFQHAAQTLAEYVSNPQDYKPMPPTDDPVHPDNQLPRLLNAR